MISTELSMIQMLNPIRNALASDVEAFLRSGGAIEVLEGPSFQPPPVRNDPPPTLKAKAARKPEKMNWLDKMAIRDIEREQRIGQREREKVELTDRIRKLAETMTYAQAMEQTGMARRSLQRIAVEGGFKFLPAVHPGNTRQQRITVEQDAKYAERITAFIEVGLSRNQAMKQIGVTFKTFARILAKFNIDYPKRRAGPHPAFFEKEKKQG